MRKALLQIAGVLIGLLVGAELSAQDSLYARKIIKELTHEKYNGRGYVKSGDRKAADFIAAEFKRLNLEPVGSGSWYQKFSFPVNTFPEKVSVQVDGTKLVPGKDFIIDPGMSSLKGKFPVVRIVKPMAAYSTEEIRNKFIIIDTIGTGLKIDKDEMNAWKKNVFKAAGMILIQPQKLTWSVSTFKDEFPVIEVLKSAFPDKPEFLYLDIESKWIEEYQTANVVGYLKGTTQPDSFLFVTAHYDHLGRMGAEAYFPGANDNASGVSMLLNLASFYANPVNRLKYSMVFIAFAGEEAGLIGSKFYTDHPLVPLGNIRFLLNLDLMGAGDDGMMVVNATEFPQAFSAMDSINTALQLLPKMGKRGKAANSDHYFFTEKGVPSFFCYTLGGTTAYHDIYDVEVNLPLTRYKEVFNLFRNFLSSF